jgi:pimeloyl-ACP methyl ester carboxylesterase
LPYVTAGDQRIFYTEQGDGDDTVLMVHGWACDGADWSWLAADLGSDHRCVMIDNRGHGRSSPGLDGYGAQISAADAAQVIEQLGLGRPVVIGHSMGAIISTALAVERPDLVRALVLVDPGYGAKDASLEPVMAAVRQAPHAVAWSIFERFYGDRTPSWLPVWHHRRLLGTDEATVRDAVIGVFEGEHALGRKVVMDAFLRRKQVPSLAVYAGAASATAEWDRTLDHGPHDEVVVWDEHGHFLHQEAPERFAAAVRTWLDGLPAA